LKKKRSLILTCGEMIYLIDSYAWIEYFNGTKKGEVLKKLFLDENKIFLTVECCLAEMKGWALKNNVHFDPFYRMIHANSQIVKVTEQNWLAAAEERFHQRISRPNFGMIDAVLLVKQKELQAKVVSGDIHFKNLKDVIFMD